MYIAMNEFKIVLGKENEFENLWKKNNSKIVVSKVLSKKEFWDQDLTQIPNLAVQLEDILDFLASENIESAYNNYINKYDYKKSIFKN